MATNDLKNLIDVLLQQDSPAVPSFNSDSSAAVIDPVIAEMRRLSSQLATFNGAGAATSAANQQRSNSDGNPLADVVTNTGRGWLSGLAKASGVGALISGIAGLFGGGKQEEVLPLEKFQLPAALRVQSALTADRRFNAADYGLNDQPRTPGTGPGAQQITVNVQALDSRSFLDHSDEIAQAVRDAMLNSHALNDVVADL